MKPYAVGSLVASAALCLAPTFSCAAPPPAPILEPGSNDALVYVYRAWSFAMAARAAELSVDGTKEFVLLGHRCTRMRLPAGVHDLTVAYDKWSPWDPLRPVNITTKLEPRKTYYYRFEAKIRGKIIYSLMQVDEARATNDMRNCSFAPPRTSPGSNEADKTDADSPAEPK